MGLFQRSGKIYPGGSVWAKIVAKLPLRTYLSATTRISHGGAFLSP